MIKDDSLVSIIVPVYNAACYLERTIESILVQTYKNIEILLVDDGSTDCSREICKRYMKKDKRIKIFHSKNLGVSSARNIGINNMKGEYCHFIDSDDVIPNNYTEIMVRKIQQDDCDVVFCGVARVKGSERREFYLDNNVLQQEEYLYELYRAKKFVTKSSCIGLYKSSIIKENEIYYPMNVCCGEDSIFVMKYVQNIRRIGTVDKIVYNYMYDNFNSATAAIYYNHFLVEMERYEIANGIIEQPEIKEKVAQLYMDNEIRELVQYVIYSPESYQEKLNCLKNFLNNAGTKYSIQIYKRDTKTKSWMIPMMIKWSSQRCLYYVLNKRSKSIIRKKNLNIKSVYRVLEKMNN